MKLIIDTDEKTQVANMTEPEISPMVSIGMPVYNGEKTIREALDALLAQDFKEFELIISDNASTDDTGNICIMYAARDRRVQYYRNEMNLGPTANFNRLIHLARGKYFMWAADDDLWEPSYVSCMVEALDKNPDAVLSFCQYEIISADKQPLTGRDEWPKLIERDRFSRLLLSCSGRRGVNPGYIYGLIRKDILLKCGGMETRVDPYAAGDVATLFHLLCYGTFVKVDKLLYHRRLNQYRHTFKEPLFQRLKKQSLFPMVLSYIKFLGKYHRHYHILRVIIKETSLNALHKIILLIMLYKAEFLFYFNNIIHTSKFWNRNDRVI